MSRAKGPIRRAQLITPFGVGAMTVVRDGLSLITCGLDHWFEREDGTSDNLDIGEYQVNEWRLENLLGVNHFRLPPDYRPKWGIDDIPNTELTMPFLRFPQWHLCPTCKKLEKIPLTSREKVQCSDCKKKNKTRYMVQVSIVAICAKGHLQDFPWREWAHSSVATNCQETLRLYSTGGAALIAQNVHCDCGAKRNLGTVTSASGEINLTVVTHRLDKNNTPYSCKGNRPWLGEDEDEPCDQPLQGALRGATNVHYAKIVSSIYIPQGTNTVSSELLSLLEDPGPTTIIKTLAESPIETIQVVLRSSFSEFLLPYSNKVVEEGIKKILNKSSPIKTKESKLENEDPETTFRRIEFDILRAGLDDEGLRARKTNLLEYDPEIASYFSEIVLIEKLRETRAMYGFTRIFPENSLPLDKLKELLWKERPFTENEWLPAYTVYGEGIFFVLDENRITSWFKEWENQIKTRLSTITRNYQILQERRNLQNQYIGHRLVLLHTFSHLLINQLTFECGYSTASLRERLYISNESKAPMAGLLVYTAAGDSDGTMGGLVRMGKPGNLEPVIRKAIENARWCSADPVCMEMGDHMGQGPGSCNLAACHNCALLPETSCEHFNRFLDRALVIGSFNNQSMGFLNKT